MRTIFLLFTTLPLFAACSVAAGDPTSDSPEAAPPHYEPPPGCSRTACDVDLDRCQASAEERCATCKADCAAIQIEYRLQCYSVCSDICANTTDTQSRCRSDARVCKAASPRNAFCADGIAVECVPLASYAHSMAANLSAHRAACSDAEIDGLLRSCFSSTSSDSACQSFAAAHSRCLSCAVGSTGAEPLWTKNQNAKHVWTNDGLCVALRGHADCGRAIFAADSCAAGACDACANDAGSCATAAYDFSCATFKASKDACIPELPAEVRVDCVVPTDSTADFVEVVRPRIAQTCGA